MIGNMCLFSQILTLYVTLGIPVRRMPRSCDPMISNASSGCNYCTDGFYLSQTNFSCEPCDTCSAVETTILNCSKTYNTICREYVLATDQAKLDDTLYLSSILPLAAIATTFFVLSILVIYRHIQYRRISKRLLRNYLQEYGIRPAVGNFDHISCPANNLNNINSQFSINDMEDIGRDIEIFQKDLRPKSANITSNLQKDIATQTLVCSQPINNSMNTEWDRSCVIDLMGGTLEKEGSDVLLTFPKHAIPSKRYVDVFGSVYTNLQAIYERFDIDDTQFIISPVVEFSLGENTILDKYAVITVPHCATRDKDSIKVQWFPSNVSPSEKIKLQEVKRKAVIKKNNEFLDMFYEVKDGNILVYTKHFSGFICTQCKASVTMTLCMTVFGAYHYVETREGEWNINVRSYIHDQRFSIKDFKTSLKEQENLFERKYLDQKQICRTPCEDMTITANLRLSESEEPLWKHKTFGDNEIGFTSEQGFPLADVLSCPDHVAQHTIDWILSTTDQSTPRDIQCWIVVKCLNPTDRACAEARSTLDKTTIFFTLTKTEKLSKQSFSTYQFNKQTTEILCQLLEENLSLEKCMTFCRLMGVRVDKIDELLKRFQKKLPKEFIGRLFDTCTKAYDPRSFFEAAISVLKRMHEYQLLLKLTNNSDHSIGEGYESYPKYPIQESETGHRFSLSIFRNDSNTSAVNQDRFGKDMDETASKEQYGIQCESFSRESNFHLLHIPDTNPLNFKTTYQMETISLNNDTIQYPIIVDQIPQENNDDQTKAKEIVSDVERTNTSDSDDEFCSRL